MDDKIDLKIVNFPTKKNEKKIPIIQPPIADKDNTCSVGDLVELYNYSYQLSKMRVRSTVGLRLNANMSNINNIISKYQSCREEYINKYGIINKLTGQKEIPLSEKNVSKEDKENFYKASVGLAVLSRDLTKKRHPMPQGLRKFYINEDRSDFPEESGVLPFQFKILQDFGLIHEGKNPNLSKPKK